MVSTDPDKYFRFTFSRNGQGTENYFIKAETACAKTDSTYRLFQSALAGENYMPLRTSNKNAFLPAKNPSLLP